MKDGGRIMLSVVTDGIPTSHLHDAKSEFMQDLKGRFLRLSRSPNGLLAFSFVVFLFLLFWGGPAFGWFEGKKPEEAVHFGLRWFRLFPWLTPFFSFCPPEVRLNYPADGPFGRDIGDTNFP